MTRDRFGFLEHHGFVAFVFGQQAQGGGYRFVWRIRFLVALSPLWDLLLFAKNLFVAAKVAWHEVQPSHGKREASSAVVGRIAAILPDTHAPNGQPGHSVVGPGWLVSNCPFVTRTAAWVHRRLIRPSLAAEGPHTLLGVRRAGSDKQTFGAK
jgi:hypothetical protein